MILARRGGMGALLKQLLLRFYSTSKYIWLEKEAGPSQAQLPSRADLILRPASPEDIRVILDHLEEGKGRDIFEILRRASFFSRGFDGCYLAVTASGAICHLGWLLTARHNALIRSEYPPGTDDLNEGEALVENILTFPRFRGQGIMLSVLRLMENLAWEQGLIRMVAYVETSNIPSLKGFERAGYKPFAEELEIRRFFKIRRTGKSAK